MTSRRPFGSRLLGPAEQSPRRLRVRIQLLLTGFLITTNIVGAGLVFLISFVVIPGPDVNRATILATAIGVPVYVVIAVVLGGFAGTMKTLRTVRWTFVEGAVPTAKQRRRVLRAPLILTGVQAFLWLGATVLFTLLAAFLQPERAMRTGLTLGTATLVVSGVVYLLAEFTLRPVAARALVGARATDRPRGAGLRTRLAVVWLLGNGVPAVVLAVAAILALSGVTDATRFEVTGLVLAGVIVVFGFTLVLMVARSVHAPLTTLRRAMRRVERGDLGREVVVFDSTELGLLQAGYNHMVGGLRDREKLRERFGRHVGHQVAQLAGAEVDEIELGGETRTVAVLFVDLTGSTTYAEEHAATEVVEVLNRFFGVVVDGVDENAGLVNKFLGDAVLAIFGAPVSVEDHAGAALSAARTIARRLTEEVTEIGFGVGAATGEVVVGHVGHQDRFEYTAIGDTVNRASRLTDLAKQVEGRVLVDAETVRSAREQPGVWVEDDEVTLRGRREATTTYVLSPGAPGPVAQTDRDLPAR